MERLWVARGEIEGRAAKAGVHDETPPLLQAALAGDRAALEQLLGEHERPLLVLCRGMLGHVQDAEDAVQETFLHALRALPTFRGDSDFRTWIFRIAINLCLNRKRNQRPTEAWDESREPQPATASPETIALRQLQVREALAALEPRRRTVFLLKVLMGWSVAEIADATGWNRIRVQNELSRARQTLARWRQDAGEGESR